jgi:hypothetical protein
MNLTPEELQFFRAQRMAASTEAIPFNFALCSQLMTVIPAQQFQCFERLTSTILRRKTLLCRDAPNPRKLETRPPSRPPPLHLLL